MSYSQTVVAAAMAIQWSSNLTGYKRAALAMLLLGEHGQVLAVDGKGLHLQGCKDQACHRDRGQAA